MSLEKRIEAIEGTLNLINITMEDMIKRINIHFERIQEIERIIFDVIKINDLKLK